MAIRYTIGIEKIALSKRGFESLVQDSKKLISRISNAEGGMGNGWIEYLVRIAEVLKFMFLNGLIATVVNHPTMLHATSAVMKQRQNSLPMKKQLIIGTGVHRLIFIMPTRVKRAYTAILFRKSKEHQSYIFKVNSKSACIEHWLYA